MTLTICVNYGGRAEIADAARGDRRDVAAGRLDPEKVNEKTVARYLYYPDMPDVDLFLRPSGEQRTSNFLLWQAAYAEMVFQDVLWPDFDRRDLWRACEEYASATAATAARWTPPGPPPGPPPGRPGSVRVRRAQPQRRFQVDRLASADIESVLTRTPAEAASVRVVRSVLAR